MKIKRRNNFLAGAIGSYVLLESSKSKTDPYSRFVAGALLGAAFGLSQNPYLRATGTGIGVASFLQLLDVKHGGKLVVNNYSGKFYALHEKSGITEFSSFEIPDFSIDGIAIPGSNAVYKVSDGVYITIDDTGHISTTFGIGGFINRLRRAGYKSGKWALLQPDKRWYELYKLSS